ncbi:MAG: DUF1566 domain-containing protein [Bacteroidetes bacterium]|nr:MAG: DUF1566 domain-containing protein [Bacteroidota bacterium]
MNTDMKKQTITLDGVEYELTPVIKKESLVVEHQTKLEIYPHDLGRMTWDNAMKTVEELGEGWRLPTILEFYIIYNSSVKNKFKTDDYYWSSAEGNHHYAWRFGFYNGYAGYSLEDFAFYVRAVRALTI